MTNWWFRCYEYGMVEVIRVTAADRETATELAKKARPQASHSLMLDKNGQPVR